MESLHRLVHAVLRSEANQRTVKFIALDPNSNEEDVQNEHDRLIPLLQQLPQPRIRLTVAGQNLETLQAMLQRMTTEEEIDDFWYAIASADWINERASLVPLIFELAAGSDREELAMHIALLHVSNRSGWKDAIQWIRLHQVIYAGRHSCAVLSQWVDQLERPLAELDKVIENLREYEGAVDVFLAEGLRSDLQELRIDIANRIALQLHTEFAQGINPEINADKKHVQGRIASLGFTPELSDVLDAADRTLFSNDKFDWKSCMVHLRTFVHELLVNIVKKIQPMTGQTFSGDYQKFVQIRDYLRLSGVDFLRDLEWKMVEFLQDWTSAKGVHLLAAERDNCRIARNIVIEFSLFLLRRFEEYSLRNAPSEGVAL
jgi:hypothetical protein